MLSVDCAWSMRKRLGGSAFGSSPKDCAASALVNTRDAGRGRLRWRVARGELSSSSPLSGTSLPPLLSSRVGVVGRDVLADPGADVGADENVIDFEERRSAESSAESGYVNPSAKKWKERCLCVPL